MHLIENIILYSNIEGWEVTDPRSNDSEGEISVSPYTGHEPKGGHMVVGVDIWLRGLKLAE